MSRALEYFKAHLNLLYDILNVFRLLPDFVHINLKALSSDLIHIYTEVGTFLCAFGIFKIQAMEGVLSLFLHTK